MNTMLRGSSATQKSKEREISCTAKAMPAPLASTIAARHSAMTGRASFARGV